MYDLYIIFYTKIPYSKKYKSTTHPITRMPAVPEAMVSVSNYYQKTFSLNIKNLVTKLDNLHSKLLY